MQPQIENLFDEAEKRYLKPEELGVLSQYVESLPERLAAYRTLRDQELQMMQQVANQLEAELPQEKTEVLERSLKNALLTLRYCALGMLMNDQGFVQNRLLPWLTQSLEVYDTRAVDAVLYRLLKPQLQRTLSSQDVGLLTPFLTLAETSLLGQSKEELPLTAANLF